MADLETPSDLDSIYRGRGEEVDTFRPVLTGDVFQVEGDSSAPPQLLLILQHPCALRVDGVNLYSSLLAARVVPFAGLRSDWARITYKMMPLPNLLGDGQHYAASFVELRTVESAVLQSSQRVATLSEVGIHHLLQRWVFHSTRVVVKTVSIHESVVAQLEEAELLAEWLRDLDGLEDDSASTAAFHDWVRGPLGAGALSRQDALTDPRRRAAVRREMVAALRIRESTLR